MTALMVPAGIIAFFALIFLLLFLLVAKVRFRFDTDTGVFGLSIRVLFVNINLLPVDEKKKRKKQLKKAKKLAKNKGSDKHVFTAKEKKKEAIEELEKNAGDTSDKKKTISEKIASFAKLVTSISEKIKILVPGVKQALCLDIKRLDIVVGGEDAAKTAISYGAVCGAVESLYALGNRCKKFNVSDKVFVAVDYLEPKFRCEFDIVLKVRVFRLLTAVLKAFL